MIYDFALTGKITPAFPKVEYRPRLTVARIQQEVAYHYGLDPMEMISHRRTKAIACARQVAMYLARHMTTQSFPDIGRRFQRDHTTVIHGVNEIERKLKGDPILAADCAILRERLAA